MTWLQSTMLALVRRLQQVATVIFSRSQASQQLSQTAASVSPSTNSPQVQQSQPPLHLLQQQVLMRHPAVQLSLPVTQPGIAWQPL